MISIRFAASAFLASLTLVACGADPERIALEAYLNAGEEVANAMVETGGKFETLMNVQGNVLAWSQAEKDELALLVSGFGDIEAAVNAMTPPALLADIHPTLVSAVSTLHEAVKGVAEMAENPTAFTMERGAEIEQSADKSNQLADKFFADLEAALRANYPDLVTEE